jgi:integrase
MSTPKREAKEQKNDWPFITYHPDRKRPWLVDSRTKGGGKEGSRKFFETKREAETFAAQCRIKRGNEGTGAFGNADLAKYGKTVQQAIDFYLDHLRAMEKSVTVEKAMEELINARKAAGRSERYRRDLKNRLTRFAGGFSKATVATITAREIEEWLAGLDLAPGTRNTFRRDIRTLFSFCEKRGYCRTNEAAKTDRAKDVDKPAAILTPTQAAALLSKCDDELTPYTAISLFAGLRAAEVEKLDWSEVDLEGGHIEVTASKSKTQRRRLVPISDNLRAWIKDLAKKSGPVAPVNLRKKLDACRRLVGFGTPGAESAEEKKAGVKLDEWPSNSMRHSFGSYRLAQCQDAAKVSLEMGNSPQMVFAHYRELVKPKAATAYWGIIPVEDKGNVVEFQEKAA